MKKVTAYKCGFCNKVLITKLSMVMHEKRCFKNPRSKSCITCEHFGKTRTIDGKEFTKEQQEIYNYKVAGTFSQQVDPEGIAWLILNKEYSYLYDADVENYCKAVQCVLKKLKTECHMHETKIEI